MLTLAVNFFLNKACNCLFLFKPHIALAHFLCVLLHLMLQFASYNIDLTMHYLFFVFVFYQSIYISRYDDDYSVM